MLNDFYNNNNTFEDFNGEYKLITVNDRQGVFHSSTSKGNQTKYKVNNQWVRFKCETVTFKDIKYV